MDAVLERWIHLIRVLTKESLNLSLAEGNVCIIILNVSRLHKI